MGRVTMFKALAVGLCALLAVGGCAGLRLPDVGQRTMTVEFTKARSFYPESRVMVMGAEVGRVETVVNAGDRIRVTFRIDEDVPLPRGVRASIVPLNLVGERNLVLHPAWKPGQPRESSDHIPMSRTSVPVEVDDALASFTNLANALDPTKVRSALGTAADTVDGNGREFNATLEQSARLIENVAGQDQELLQVARNLDRLAGVVRGREQVVGQLIRDFAEATRVLSAERGELQELIRGILELAEQGDRLLKKYKGQLPGDLVVLTRFALVMKGNSKELAQLLQALPGIDEALIGGYDAETKALRIRFASDAFLRTWLRSLLDQDDAPCPLPPPNSNCPWTLGGGN
jgi:phospholipid/cholesterol/gamma-HCH transport system substrate-binding protein